MKHLISPAKGILCGAILGYSDTIVPGALQSDCIDCRTIAKFIPHVKTMDADGEGVAPVREWVPEPMENADEIIAEVVRRRDAL